MIVIVTMIDSEGRSSITNVISQLLICDDSNKSVASFQTLTLCESM